MMWLKSPLFTHLFQTFTLETPEDTKFLYPIACSFHFEPAMRRGQEPQSWLLTVSKFTRFSWRDTTATHSGQGRAMHPPVLGSRHERRSCAPGQLTSH